MKRRKLHPTLPLASFDRSTLLLVLLLCLMGIVMIFNASHIDAYVQFGDKFRYAKLQSIWFLVSLCALSVSLFFPVSKLKAVSPYVMGISLILLMVVLIPGIGSQFQGARRWLQIGNVVIQPSEIAKLALVVYLPYLYTKKNFIQLFAALLGLVVFLVIIEPDFGTAIIVTMIGIGSYFLSGASLKPLFGIMGAMAIIGSIFIVFTPYRLNRVKTFFNPSHDPQGTSYHVRQILIALGSGGLTGTGLGRSKQKFQYLPEATTDSIFAVIAEETGFVGASLLVGLFFFICLRMLSVSAKITDPYAKVMAGTVSIWFIFQIVVNLSAMVSLIPLTGIPLPFISYGGSALLAALVGVGLYANASRLRNI